jgi:hypothetical protein
MIDACVGAGLGAGGGLLGEYLPRGSNVDDDARKQRTLM